MSYRLQEPPNMQLHSTIACITPHWKYLTAVSTYRSTIQHDLRWSEHIHNITVKAIVAHYPFSEETSN